MLVGAGVGALLGGAGGYAVGSSVASRKQQYVNEEDRLDGEIQVFAKYNSDLEEFNNQTAAQIQILDQQIAELKSQSSTSQARATALQAKQNEIKKRISESDQRKSSLNKELAALDQDQQRMNKSQDQAKVEKLNQEVNTLKENIAVLDARSVEMAKLNESTTLRK
jgi:chromosome segregation ATPase